MKNLRDLLYDCLYDCRPAGGKPPTVASVADRCGISRAYLYLLLSGERRNPSPEVVIALARALGVSPGRVRKALRS